MRWDDSVEDIHQFSRLMGGRGTANGREQKEEPLGGKAGSSTTGEISPSCELLVWGLREARPNPGGQRFPACRSPLDARLRFQNTPTHLIPFSIRANRRGISHKVPGAISTESKRKTGRGEEAPWSHAIARLAMRTKPNIFGGSVANGVENSGGKVISRCMLERRRGCLRAP